MSQTLISPAPGQGVHPGRVYCIRDGRVIPDRRERIPLHGVRLPTHGTGCHAKDPEDDHRRAMPALDAADREDATLEWTLPVLAELQAQLVPWTTWWIAPRWDGDDRHPCMIERGDRFRGIAYTDQDDVLLASRIRCTDMLSTACHEAWHMCEPYLSDTELAAVNTEACGDGAMYWPDRYYRSPIERRARLFQRWSDYLREGGTHFLPQGGPLTAAKVFLAFWDGQVGCEVMAGIRRHRPVTGRLEGRLAEKLRG